MINDNTDFNDETYNENDFLCTQECLVYIYSICFSTLQKLWGGGTFSTCTNIFLNFLLVLIIF